MLLCRKRLIVVLIFILCLFGALLLRVAYWSLVRGAELEHEAERQWISDTEIRAQRGSILDRGGNVLAQSAAADTVVLMPQEIEDPENVATQLANILNLDRQEVLTTASTKTRTTSSGEERDIVEVWLKRQITEDQSAKIESLGLEGVRLIADVRRYYPNKSLASQLIGYTNLDGEGQTGIERRFNSVLEGRQGRVVAETDKLRNGIPNGEEMTIDPVDGQNVVLALDEVVQSYLDAGCTQTYEETGATTVQGIIMDVKTRQILGLSNIPAFDLNEPPRSDSKTLAAQSSNITASRAYEPGSIFTIITAAAALDSGNTADSYECRGAEVVGGAEINCSEPHGVQTFEQALANGCAVAAAHMAEDMGRETFYSYLEAFGFGKKTGTELTGEGTGVLMEMKYASEDEIARMGSGQSLKVTQLQFINALSSLLDDGTMTEPIAVLALENPGGTPSETFEATVTGNSVSEETASDLVEVLADTSETTDGYSIAMITGFSLQPKDTVDSPVSRAVSMCAAFAPADDPNYVLLMTLNGEDESQITPEVLTPYAEHIMSSVLQYEQVRPQAPVVTEEPSASATPIASGTTVEVPAVVGLELSEAIQLLEEHGLSYRANGTGEVEGQYPYAGDSMEAWSEVRLEMSVRQSESNGTSEGGGGVQTAVPDFTGMTFEQAMEAADQAGLVFLAQGTGKAVSQTPVAGAMVERGATVTVTFRLDLD